MIRKIMTKIKEPSAVEVMMDPGKYGYTPCTHCSGYGSSLKEEAARCTVCRDSKVPGLVKKVVVTSVTA